MKLYTLNPSGVTDGGSRREEVREEVRFRDAQARGVQRILFLPGAVTFFACESFLTAPGKCPHLFSHFTWGGKEIVID